jgi:acyl carrier protein
MGLDAVELVIRFEEAFGIPIPDDVAASLTTPREVADYVMTQVAADNGSHNFKRTQRVWTRAQVEETVRAIVVDEIGIKDFTQDSHFVNDMHID